jgi:hypothetical protein
MENKKQTAVEWLEYKLANTPTEELVFRWRNIFDQAKAMEKEQIISSFDEGKSDGYKTAREWDEMIVWLSAEQYYNETYGK